MFYMPAIIIIYVTIKKLKNCTDKRIIVTTYFLCVMQIFIYDCLNWNPLRVPKAKCWCVIVCVGKALSS